MPGQNRLAEKIEGVEKEQQRLYETVISCHSRHCASVLARRPMEAILCKPPALQWIFPKTVERDSFLIPSGEALVMEDGQRLRPSYS